MNSVLSGISLIVGLAALILCTLERRAPGRFPLATLLRDRFGRPRTDAVLAGLALGTLVIVAPLALSVGLGWARISRVQVPAGHFILLGAATLLIKFLWAAGEELIYRGAVLPRVARLTNGPVALAISALVFTCGHLERGGARAPDAISLLVFLLDGIGFGLACVATRSLWMPTFWHAARNAWIWLLCGGSTIELTPGPLRVSDSGPTFWLGTAHQAGGLDLAAALLAVMLVAGLYRRRLAGGLTWARTG